MSYDLDRCPECGYVNKNRPDVCPSCGSDLKEYRSTVYLKMMMEAQEAAERERIERIEDAYKEAIRLFNEHTYISLQEAQTQFMALGDYKEAVAFAEKCKEGIYQISIKVFHSNRFLKNLVNNEESFDYFNMPFVQSCMDQYTKYDFTSVKARFERLEDYKQARKHMDYCDKAVELFELYDQQATDYQKYSKAMALYNDGQYEKAIAAFKKIENVLDSKDFIIKCQEAIYQQALKKLESGNYEAALEEVKKIPQVKETTYLDDIAEKHNEIMQQHALERLESDDHNAASREPEKLPQSKDESVSADFKENYNKKLFQRALELLNSCEYKFVFLKELKKIIEAEDHSDCDALAKQCYEALYQHALQTLESGNYEAALKEFLKLPQSEDETISDDFAKKYQWAIFYHAQELYLSRDYVAALEETEKLFQTEEFPHHVELKEKCVKKLYQSSAAQFENKNYEEALRGFQKITGYQDSADYIDRAKKEIEKTKLSKQSEKKKTMWKWKRNN